MMRILCCGNRDRGDDAAGILVAERLQELGIEAERCSEGALELIDSWNDAEDVLIIDAVVTGDPAGTIHAWDADDVKFRLESSISTHGIGLSEAIALARTLGRLPARLRIWGIEARQFEAGSPISFENLDAVERVATAVAEECLCAKTDSSIASVCPV